MKISTFNIKNNFFKHVDKTDYLISFIEKYDLDILGVQEYLYCESKKFKLDDYKCVGKGRYRKTSNVFNETCSVITNCEILNYKTIKLPWFFTSFPRIMTVVNIKYKNKEYLVINTHLDYLHKISQRKQLKYILKYLSNINHKNIIMMGDFNLNVHTNIFKHFLEELNKLNITRVNISEATFKNLDKPIDHIFISSDIKVNDVKIIKDDEFDISDHYPLYIEIK